MPSTNVGIKDLATHSVHEFLTRDGHTTEAIIQGGFVYLRLDEATAAAAGKGWVARKYSAPAPEMLIGRETVVTAVKAATIVTDHGPTPTDDGDLSRIEATFVPGRYSDPHARGLSDLMKKLQATAVSVDLFLDDAGRLHRYRVTWPPVVSADPEEGLFRMVLIRDYHAFDMDPEIVIPRAGDVLMQGHLPPDLGNFPVIGSATHAPGEGAPRHV